MSYFRVHPAINSARVGTSKEYYIAPETAAGEVVDPGTGLFGGLPIKAGTEDTPIQEADLRDAEQNPKRQAARFHIHAFDSPQDQYPGKDKGREIKIGDRVGGKTVKDIIWTVHLANKKNNNYAITAQEYRVVDGNYVQTGVELGIAAYEDGALPPLRNPEYGLDPGAEERRGKLVTDAGPRALAASTNGAQVQAFDKQQTPCYADHEGAIQDLPDYPVSFPGDHFSLFEPLGPIDTLGEMTVEAGTGRLIVAGGYGRASGIEDSQGQPPSLNGAIDNDGWFDDTSDGPVTAVMLFDDGSCQGGWRAMCPCAVLWWNRATCASTCPSPGTRTTTAAPPIPRTPTRWATTPCTGPGRRSDPSTCIRSPAAATTRPAPPGTWAVRFSASAATRATAPPPPIPSSRAAACASNTTGLRDASPTAGFGNAAAWISYPKKSLSQRLLFRDYDGRRAVHGCVC